MKWSKKKRTFIIIDFIMILILIGIDQFTKHLAVINLKDKPAFPIIKGVFELNYLENRGAAFGMLQNQKGFFILISSIVLIAICYILIKMPEDKKYNIMHILLVLIASGAVGNMIDRVRLEYVVDFSSKYDEKIEEPVINSNVNYVGIGLMSISCIFFIITIIFSIIFTKHQLNSRKKLSK